MDKVYLLLRNNQETGPYSLEEILQTGLKPNDLVWIEGKSVSWSNPAEVETLRPYVIQTNPSVNKKTDEKNALPQTLQPSPPLTNSAPSKPQANSSKHIYVSLPANFVQKTPTVQEPSPAETLEQKAEELKKKIQAYSPEHKAAEADNPDEPVYPHTLTDLKNEYAAWHLAQKKAKKIRLLKRTGITALILLLLGAGYGLAKEEIYTKKNKPGALIVKNDLKKKPAVPLTINDSALNVKETAITEPSSASYDSIQKITTEKPLEVLKKKNSLSTPPQSKVNIAVPKTPDAAKGSALPVLTETATVKADSSTTSGEKKETLGEKGDNSFKSDRKKTDEEPGKTSIPPAPDNIADWMNVTYASSFNQTTGVQDLNFTLNNYSNELVKNASVEVRYFNAKNNLLEKKILTFVNILPKKSVTVRDQYNGLVNHTYYRLLSATN